MLTHNFKYAFKTLFRNKSLIFWTFAFPIILGTFFYLAFSDIENSEKLDIIDIAIVESEDFNEVIKESFKVLSDEESEERLFNTKYVDEKKAKELLEDDKITGYLIMEEDSPKVVVKSNGINETILKFVTDEILERVAITTDILNRRVKENIKKDSPEENYITWHGKIYKDVLKLYEESNGSIKDISNTNLSYTMIEFYTLIAMACLYGGILSMVTINNYLANMGNIGKRTSVTPISKGKMIISSLAASYLTQLIGLALLFLYTIFILKVDYGTNLPLIILLAIVGSASGLSLGIAIATLLKANENVKTGILLAITMTGCFLSGMMGITMKYIIDKNIPIINMINPASMITDGFYALYYYDTLDRYFFNIISLIIFSIVMIFISIRGLRRQKYDSI